MHDTHSMIRAVKLYNLRNNVVHFLSNFFFKTHLPESKNKERYLQGWTWFHIVKFTPNSHVVYAVINFHQQKKICATHNLSQINSTPVVVENEIYLDYHQLYRFELLKPLLSISIIESIQFLYSPNCFRPCTYASSS